MQTPHIGGSDVHGRPLSNRLQPFQDLNVVRTVSLCRHNLSFISHRARRKGSSPEDDRNAPLLCVSSGKTSPLSSSCALLEEYLRDDLVAEPRVQFFSDLLPVEQKRLSPRRRLDPNLKSPLENSPGLCHLRDLRSNHIPPQKQRPSLHNRHPKAKPVDQSDQPVSDRPGASPAVTKP